MGPQDDELRWDQHRRDWVLMSPSRAQYAADTDGPALLTAAADCPFCSRDPARTPPEVFRLPDGTGGWRVRVVADRHPLFSEQPAAAPGKRPGHGTRATVGRHEVVIESPRHDWRLATAPPAQIADVLLTWQHRLDALRAGDGLTLAFRRYDGASGISVKHPHSQIIAMPVVPAQIRHEVAIAREYFHRNNRCLRADALAADLEDGSRIVLAQDDHVVVAPFASGADFELDIVPRRNRASFAAVPAGELTDLATALGHTLRALNSELGDPPYTLVLHTAPSAWPTADFLCWRIRVVPGESRLSGFQLGTGTSVCTRPPEDAAARLRRWLPHQ